MQDNHAVSEIAFASVGLFLVALGLSPLTFPAIRFVLTSEPTGLDGDVYRQMAHDSTMLFAGLGLIFLRRPLARVLAPRTSSISKAKLPGVQAAALSVVGAFSFVEGLSESATLFFGRTTIPELFLGSLVKAFLGFVLLVGGGHLAKLLHRLQSRLLAPPAAFYGANPVKPSDSSQ